MNIIPTYGDIENNTVIIASSLVRTHYMGIILIGIFVLALERFVASHFIADYEIKERRYISVVFVSVKSFLAAVCSVFFTYEIIHWSILACLGVSFTFLGSYMFIRIDTNNRTKFEDLQRNHRLTKTQYSLSLRFQMAENIKSTQIIKKALVMTIFQNVTNFGLYVCANLDLVRRKSETASELIETAFNCSIALYGFVIAVAAILMHPFFAPILREAKWAACLFRDKRQTSSVDNETNVYFSTLTSQWNAQLPQSAKGIL